MERGQNAITAYCPPPNMDSSGYSNLLVREWDKLSILRAIIRIYIKQTGEYSNLSEVKSSLYGFPSPKMFQHW